MSIIKKDCGEKYIKNLTLAELCRVVKIPQPQKLDANMPIAKVYAHPEHSVKGSAVFVTYYKAERFHTRIALEHGASVVFVHPECKAKFADNPKVVAVDDPITCCTRYLSKLRSLFPAKVVCVTGSIGKTTTVDMLKCVLGDAFRLHSHHSMTNSRDGILRTIQRLHDDDEIYLQEVGAAEPGYVESSASGLRPDVVVITNISEPHIDLYGSIDNILQDKVTLVEKMASGGVAFFDRDNEYLRNYQTARDVRYYAMDKTDGVDLWTENVVSRDGILSFDICQGGDHQRWHAKLHAIGDFNARNALAAFAVGRQLGISAESIIRSLDKYRTSGMRQNYVNIGGFHMLVDCFNASLDSVIGALKALETITVPQGGRRIAILGDIAHMEGIEEEIYTRVGVNAAQCNLDLVYCFGDGMRYTYEELQRQAFPNVLYTNDRDVLNRWIQENITTRDVTLYKSSQLVGALARTIDAVYGTTFFLNSQRIPISTYEMVNRYKREVVSRYKLVDQQAEYERLVSTEADEMDVADTASGLPVYRVSPSAFSRCRKLQRVFMPDSIVNLGSAAFYICPSLTEVRLSRNLRVIEENVFNYCLSLQNIELPDSLIHIGRRAFYDCRSLEEISIPASVGFIGEEAFFQCTGLKNVYIPPRVGHIGDNAFGKCPGLTLLVNSGSYAEEYAVLYNLPYTTV